MRKKNLLLSCVVVFIATLFIKTKLFPSKLHEENSLLILNVEALSQTEEPYPEERKKCIEEGGNWNMSSVCVASGFEHVTCKLSGEIILFGVTIKGSYEKGKKYPIAWARYECKDSSGNCCKKQGLYSGEKKLA